MESEEVKDIKEKLQEEIFIANSFGDKIRKVPTKELEKILALINELENENERLNKALVDNLEAYRDGFNEGVNLKIKADNKLRPNCWVRSTT